MKLINVGIFNISLRSSGLLPYSALNSVCFSTAGPRRGTGPWHQLYRAARDSPGIDN